MTLLRLITMTVAFGVVVGTVGPFQLVGATPISAPLGVALASAVGGLDAIGLTGLVSAGRGGRGGDGGGDKGDKESKPSPSDRSNSGAKKAQEERGNQERDRQNQDAQRRRDQENQERQQQQQEQAKERQQQQEEQAKERQQQQDQDRERRQQQQQQELEQKQQQQQQQLAEQQKQKLRERAEQKEALAATQPGLTPARKAQERDEATRLKTEASAPGQPNLTPEQQQQLDAQTQERVKTNLAKQRETDLQRFHLREQAENLQEQAQAPGLTDVQRKELTDKANGILAQSEKPGQPGLSAEQRQQVIDNAKISDELANDPILTPAQADRLRNSGTSMAQILQQNPGDLTDEQWDALHAAGSQVADMMRDPNITEGQRNIFRRWIQIQQPIYIESCRNSICIDGKPPINNGNNNGNGNSNGNSNGNNNCGENGNCSENSNCNDNDGNCNGNDNGNDNNDCDDNDNNSNCNDNVGDVTNVTNVTYAAAAPTGALLQCVPPGGTLSVQAPNGQATVTASNQIQLLMALIDNASVPPPPGRLLGQMALQLNAGDCGGTVPYGVLPQEVNLNVTYNSDFATANAVDTSRLSIYNYVNYVWTPAPKQTNVPEGNAIAASITNLGVYALVQE